MDDVDQLARELREQAGNYWSEHPDYPLADWRYEVSNDATRQGYWEWVAIKVIGQRVYDDATGQG